MAVGDAVMSAGGIYGTVVALDADVVEVEVSPGVVLTFLRKAVSARPGRVVASAAPSGPRRLAGPPGRFGGWSHRR